MLLHNQYDRGYYCYDSSKRSLYPQSGTRKAEDSPKSYLDE